MATLKKIFKLNDNELNKVLNSKPNFSSIVKRLSLIDKSIFYKVKDLTKKLMSIEDLIKKLPVELVRHELTDFIIYKPKTNEELVKAIEIFTINPGESFNLHGYIENWDTSLITDMSFLFSMNKTFNSDISRWDVSKVTNMTYMFHGATSFNQPLNN